MPYTVGEDRPQLTTGNHVVPVPSLSSTNPMPIRGPRRVALLEWTSQMMEPS